METSSEPLPDTSATAEDLLDPRAEMMARIAERREQQILDEVARANEAAQPEQPAQHGDEPAAEAAPKASPQPQSPTLNPIDLGNGNVVHVNDEQLVLLARMGAVANLTLAQQSQSQPRPGRRLRAEIHP